MTEEKQQTKNSRFDVDSRFMKTLLVVAAAVLIFVGPTYFVYVAVNVAKLDYAISMGAGVALFTVGLAFLWYLVRNKTIS